MTQLNLSSTHSGHYYNLCNYNTYSNAVQLPQPKQIPHTLTVNLDNVSILKYDDNTESVHQRYNYNLCNCYTTYKDDRATTILTAMNLQKASRLVRSIH